MDIRIYLKPIQSQFEKKRLHLSPRWEIQIIHIFLRKIRTLTKKTQKAI